MIHLTGLSKMKWHDPFNRAAKPKKQWVNPRKFKSKKKWPLMPRQAMILHFYNLGLKTEDVAELMQVTVGTINKHLDRIFYKFSVNNRKAAIKKGISNELPTMRKQEH
jgi:DNA-binding NarL/FixJ family response regulator